ncbi:MAG: hypothetical protein GXP04_03945 [Alphaproteobacteria bacterium]|nr:hypothetical protein [Alphaproteobacteria bacterium]
MSRTNQYWGALTLATAFIWSSTAQAIIVSPTFTYTGQTNVEGTITNVGPDFPAGGTLRSNGSESNAVIAGSGANSPEFIFNNDAISVGEASGLSSTRIVVEITNDETNAQLITWNGLIFAGGTGIIQPFLFNNDCPQNFLDACSIFLAPPASHQATAAMEFGAKFEGVDLFDGSIFVDDTTQTANFNNIALNNLRLAPTNDQYYWWDDTNFTIDLGIFAPGETKTLEFFVAATVSSFGNGGCQFNAQQAFIDCVGAQAGFGDPDSQGGIGQGGGGGGLFLFSTSLPPEVPVPGAVWLFITGLGALAGHRKLGNRNA